MRFSFIAAALAAGLSVSAAQAAVIVNVQESGANVVIDYSGTLDLTGATFTGLQPGFLPGVTPLDGIILNLATSFDVYTLSGVLMPHGTGTGEGATSSTGDPFGFSGLAVGVDAGYVSGTTLSGSMTFVGASLFSLGYTPGVYVTALPSDTITTNVIAADVPLPAAAPMLLGALALTGFAARRRKG